MTREEFIKDVELELNYDAEIGRYNASVDCVDLVNRIFNDFESRTCENCKWYETLEYSSSLKDMAKNVVTRCSILWINKGKDFGCNKFERKNIE